MLHREKWLESSAADALLTLLQTEVPWKHQEVVIYGKKVLQPRLTCYMANVPYTYSGLKLEAAPIPSWMDITLQFVSMAARCSFNSILLNRYRDGKDSIGWHSDDEPELGPNPIVASLSLGASRDFFIAKRQNTSDTQRFVLGHGDLFIMPSGFQQEYKHSVPKRANVGERISLTFRRIEGTNGNR